MKDSTSETSSQPSLESYRTQLSGTLETYKASLKSWRTRRRFYAQMLQTWDAFGQLKENPIDRMRLDFIDNEISKQLDKFTKCQENFNKFVDLEAQMKTLAKEVPQPSVEETNISKDEVLMEIREELDDEDNIVSATVSPHDPNMFDQPLTLHNTSNEATREVLAAATGEDVSTASELTAIQEIPRDKESEHKQAKPQKPSAQSSIASKKGTVSSNSNIQEARLEERVRYPMSRDVIERDLHSQPGQHYNVKSNENGEMELSDDPNGYSIGILPAGLAEMTSIVDEMDWENEDTTDDDISEDEFGRANYSGMIPLPGLLQRPASSQELRDHIIEKERRNSSEPEMAPITSARAKKKLLFAENLVQGPSSKTGSPAKSVLKKSTAYPLVEEELVSNSPVPVLSEPKKTSRFMLQRSSTDAKIDSSRHAQPSKAFQDKLDKAVAEEVVERVLPISPLLTEEDHDRLFPKKINLAAQDLDPEEGRIKRPMVISKLTEEEMAAIKKKREALGKKNHKRRKSADPHHPVRSSSWDSTQPLQKEGRRQSSGAADTEIPNEPFDEAKLARAKEILKAQNDIAWANQPITPNISPGEVVKANPIAAAGIALEKSELQKADMDKPTLNDNSVVLPCKPAESIISDSSSKSSVSPQSPQDGLILPKPRKPPTPERRGSWNTNRPSPLSQEVTATNASKEVQFSTEVMQKLEPLVENPEEPSVVMEQRKTRKMPLKVPQRRPSVDPISISPTPKSPPPEGRQSRTLETEEEGSIKHSMVRSTPKSPPPHIAIHDLEGHTSEAVRDAVRDPQKKSNTKPPPMMSNTLPMKDTIVERPEDLVNRDMDENEIDEELHRREIRTEYHRLRSRMIAREGGFSVQEEEAELQPLEEEEETNPTERISRFKAARLGL